MINLRDEFNTNRFAINLNASEALAISRALYWYQDKISNMEKMKGRDDAEMEVVTDLRDQFSAMIKRDAFL